MKDEKITTFVDKLASKESTPGGGAAAGVSASLGAAAILMAMRFSNTDKLSEEDQASLNQAIDAIEESKAVFIEIIDRDAEDFIPLSNAYGMPKATDEEKTERSKAIQEGLLTASQPPLDLLKEADKVIDIAEENLSLIKKGIISDIGVGLQHLRAAMNSSSLNVIINARSLKDQAKKEELNSAVGEELNQSIDKVDELFNKVQEIIIN